MKRAVAAAFGLVVVTSSCASTPPSDGPSCTDPNALPLKGLCVHVVSARARENGAWTPLPSSALTIGNLDASTVTIGARVASTGGSIEAIELVLDGLAGGSMLQEGYQSWSFAGAVAIPSSVPMDADGSIATAAATSGSSADEVTGVSYGATLIGDPGAPAVAIAATDSTIATTAIGVTASGAASGATATIVFGAAREALPLDASRGFTMPPIVVASAQVATTALTKVTTTIAAALPATTTPPRRPHGGWFSWNQLFDAVTEEDVRGNVEIAAAQLFPHGMDLVEIDDGWEGPWGDWQANAKFPSGMGGVASAITARGLVPGVWLAPFLVETTSATAKTIDPSLLVGDSTGKPLVHTPFGMTRSFYVLDGSNAASMAVVGAQIEALAGVGYSFFKLDYLYAAALPGKRSQAVTGTTALRMGLATLRASMGTGAVFNACGAPIFPLLGVADSLRISSDTAYSGVSLNWADVVFAARGTAARAFLSPLVWLDGDQAQLRSPYTVDEARVGAFVAALSGPAFSIGDDLTQLPAERLALIADTSLQDLAQSSVAATPNDPLENPAQQIVVSPILDTIAAPGSTTAPPPTTFTAQGKSGAAYALTFSWTDVHSVAVLTNGP